MPRTGHLSLLYRSELRRWRREWMWLSRHLHWKEWQWSLKKVHQLKGCYWWKFFGILHLSWRRLHCRTVSRLTRCFPWGNCTANWWERLGVRSRKWIVRSYFGLFCNCSWGSVFWKFSFLNCQHIARHCNTRILSCSWHCFRCLRFPQCLILTHCRQMLRLWSCTIWIICRLRSGFKWPPSKASSWIIAHLVLNWL